MTHRITCLAVAVLVAFAPAAVWASEPAAGSDAPDAGVDWQLDLSPYLWLISADATAQLGPVRLPVSISFGDLFERLNIAGMLETQARWRRWLLLIDGRYTSLSDGKDPSYDLDQASVEFAVGRRVWTRSLGDPSEGRGLALDLFAGGRWWWTEQTLEIAGLRLRGEETWIDPILGGRVRADLTRRWVGEISADFGGFGAASDFTYNVLGQVGYRLTPRWTAELGFRALGVDFDDGTGATFFLSDLTYRGPVLGIGYRFGGPSR